MAELPAPLPSRATIGQWSTDQYFTLLRRPVIIMSVIILGLVVTEQSQTLVLVAELAGAVGVAWIISRHRGRRIESITSGAAIGLAMGLAASVGRFVLHPTVTDVFSGISETLITGIIVSLLTISATIFFSLRRTSTP